VFSLEDAADSTGALVELDDREPTVQASSMPDKGPGSKGGTKKPKGGGKAATTTAGKTGAKK
jgi:hypothetical protein